VDPTKIQVIHDWPTSKTMTELHNFLGLTKFYYKFVFGFSHISWDISKVAMGGAETNFFSAKSQ
jgi:hypothetical protein